MSAWRRARPRARMRSWESYIQGWLAGRPFVRALEATSDRAT